jgi:hypothetical protein
LTRHLFPRGLTACGYSRRRLGCIRNRHRRPSNAQSAQKMPSRLSFSMLVSLFRIGMRSNTQNSLAVFYRKSAIQHRTTTIAPQRPHRVVCPQTAFVRRTASRQAEQSFQGLRTPVAPLRRPQRCPISQLLAGKKASQVVQNADPSESGLRSAAAAELDSGRSQSGVMFHFLHSKLLASFVSPLPLNCANPG